MHLCRAEGSQHEAKHPQQVEGGDPSPQSSNGEALLECCDQSWAPSARETPDRAAQMTEAQEHPPHENG